MGIFGKKIASVVTGDIIKSAGEVVDNIITNDEERLKAKTALTDVVMSKVNDAMGMQRDVLVAEMSGSSLQKNWRPIVMLAFSFVVLYEYFISKIFGLPSSNLPERFFDLLELGIGGYVIGRSAEKIAETVTKNADISFIKKKNREINK